MNELPSIITPEQIYKRNRSNLINLWKKGIDTEDCIAYHGTCLEALQFALKTGSFPGGSTLTFIQNPLSLPQLGDIYFDPRYSNFPFEKIVTKDPEYWANRNRFFGNNYKDSIATANGAAQAMRLLSLINAPYQLFNTLTDDYMADYIYGDWMFMETKEALLEYGVTEDDLEKFHLEALKRQGIVIGLKNTAVDFFEITEGDLGDDVRINVSHGLPLEFLSGFIALGEEENQFFRELAKESY